MNISRARPLLRLTGSTIKNLLDKNTIGQVKQPVRTKVYIQYRNSEPPEEFIKTFKSRYEIYGAVLWWWILWRAFAEYHIVWGPDFPNMADWTDEELGVPPLDEDP